MNGFLKKAGLGVVLAATTLTAAMPAEAQRWGGGRGYGGGRGWHGGRGGGDVAAGAIIGGVLGLGLGAAIASNNNNRYYDRGGYYDRGYYNAPPPRAYYNAPPVAYYDDYQYQPRCYSQWRWDPYYRQNVQVRVCN